MNILISPTTSATKGHDDHADGGTVEGDNNKQRDHVLTFGTNNSRESTDGSECFPWDVGCNKEAFNRRRKIVMSVAQRFVMARGVLQVCWKLGDVVPAWVEGRCPTPAI